MLPRPDYDAVIEAQIATIPARELLDSHRRERLLAEADQFRVDESNGPSSLALLLAQEINGCS